MTRLLTSTALLTLLLGSCQKEGPEGTPETPPKVVEVPAKVSIASVSMLEDCPDAKPEEDPPAHEEEKRAMDSEADSDGRYAAQPCTQSTIQLAITSAAAARLSIKELRLLGPKGETVATLKARLPTQWKGSGYTTWDEMVTPGGELKASYKLSVPNWSEVETKMGGSSYGAAFLIEADIQIGDSTTTTRSGQVMREPVEMIET